MLQAEDDLMKLSFIIGIWTTIWNYWAGKKIPNIFQGLNLKIAAIEKKLKKDIPITKHLQFSILKLNEKECILSSKLKPNINHKGTVFGGSQFSLCAVAAYAYVLKWISHHKIETENIVISEGNIRYRKPVAHDFKVTASLSSEVVFQDIGEGKKRIIFPIICYVLDKKMKCSEFVSKFIVQY